jgi:hypothetical protein
MRLIQSIAKTSLLLQTVRQGLVALGESAIIASMTIETLSVPLAEKATLVRDAVDQEYPNQVSFPLSYVTTRESNFSTAKWFPAFAGMTKQYLISALSD